MLKNWFTSPKTTIGAVIAVAALAGLWAGKMDSTTAITLIGLAAVWIGVSAKDQVKPPTE